MDAGFRAASVARQFRFGIALAALFFIALTALPVDAQTGNTALIVSGPLQDPITRAGSYYYLPANGTFTLSHERNDGLRVTFLGASIQERWDLFFFPPAGTMLEAASYENCQRFPTDTAGGLEVDGFGTGCDHLSGSFIVHELVRDPNGMVESFHISFEQSCFGTDPPLAGEIFYNSSHQLPPAPVPTPIPKPGVLPVISVSVSPKQIVEGSDAIFIFTINPAPPLPLTFGITEVNSGAREVLFGATNSISIGAGVSAVTMTLHTNADTAIERKQKFKVQILKAPFYKIGRQKSATVIIVDPSH